MDKLRRSKYVSSYFVKEHTNGIMSLTFNTTEKWLDFHRYSENEYYIGVDNEGGEASEDSLQEIPLFLNELTSYIKTSQQEKDQITFYFIPLNLITDKRIIKSEAQWEH